MNFDFAFYLVLGAVAGGFINGLSGTGTALFALGFYLVVLDPVQAVAIVALMSVL
ncbi:MAG: sulfite exporter TauE/SafE family protein, partial [Pseudomonadota bacterium]